MRACVHVWFINSKKPAVGLGWLLSVCFVNCEPLFNSENTPVIICTIPLIFQITFVEPFDLQRRRAGGTHERLVVLQVGGCIFLFFFFLLDHPPHSLKDPSSYGKMEKKKISAASTENLHFLVVCCCPYSVFPFSDQHV